MNLQSLPGQNLPENKDVPQLLSLLQNVMLALEEASAPELAFTYALAHICQFMDWPLAHAYIWSQAANAFVSSKVWYADDADAYTAFRNLSEAQKYPRGGMLGLPIEIETETAVIVPDMRQDVRFAQRMPTVREPITGYLAFPIKTDEVVTAVLEFFTAGPANPDADTIAIVEHIGSLLTVALQKQRTLTQLTRSESQLAEAQRTAHVGHWEWDMANGEIVWSEELYHIFGLDPVTDQAQFDAILEFVHPDDQEYVRQKLARAQETAEPFDYFHRIIRPDKQERVIHARGQAIFDQAGNFVKLYGTVQDMTRQKEAELKLAQTVRQLTAMVELGQAVTSTLDISELYEQVLTLIRPLIGAKTLLLFLHTKGVLEVVAHENDSPLNLAGYSLPLVAEIEGEVWRNRQSLLLQEEACQAKLLPHHKNRTGFQPKSLALVPITIADETLGVLEAAHPEDGAFTTQDLRLLEITSAWTAIAIDNARQYAQLQRRLRESDAIAEITNALTETLDLESLLQLIADHANDVVPNAEWSTIHLVQPQDGRLELAASAGRQVNPADYLVKQGTGIIGYIMSEGGVANVADVQSDPRRLPINIEMQVRSMLVVPVESRRRRVGTISVQCTKPAIFTKNDERLLTLFGVQAGIALENARLYKTSQRARRVAEKQRERMRLLAQRVVVAQEEERARIARELHDESGQSLTSLKISLDMIRMMVPEELADIKEGLGEILDLTDKTMSNLRLLSHNLRPPGLDVYGLSAALEGLCHDFNTHTPLSLQYLGEELPDLDSLAALSLYRFAQEGITNAVKHAQASQIQVKLAQNSDTITLTVIDDGVGFEPPDMEEAVPASGAGLIGMVERLEMVDGSVMIHSKPGEGSRLTAVIPVKKKE
ncbi:MAG: GAF domain-containing protein [Anaerolineales bacterium]|nr:GAF domain-containing protein [Anaerolineales bacterium]